MSYLPKAFLESMRDVPGFDAASFIEVHESGEQSVAVRIHPYKSLALKPEISVSDLPFSEKVLWSEHGFYLATRPAFYLDPHWHAGAYYVQEASSMCIEQILKQSVDLSRSLRVLDLCAAPGGKSTLMEGMLTPDSMLVSNEVIRSRGRILEENMTKWGMPGAVITQEEASTFQRLPHFFDIILVDAPCSGSGLFRKNRTAVNEWSQDQVMHCSLRQKRILSDILPALKPGGLLIYSTCSYSPQEDEDIADWLLKDFPLASVPQKFAPDCGVIESISRSKGAKGYRFYPDKVGGEGFFISCFQHTGSPGHQVVRNKRIPYGNADSGEIAVMNDWLVDRWPLTLIKVKDEIIAVPAAMEEYLGRVAGSLHIRQSGIHLGKIIRNELIPSPALATSILLKSDTQRVQLTKSLALQYLRREDLSLECSMKGWVAVEYAGSTLGWLKMLSGRMNNYFPREWRIVTPNKD